MYVCVRCRAEECMCEFVCAWVQTHVIFTKTITTTHVDTNTHVHTSTDSKHTQFLLTAMAHYLEAQEEDVEQHLVSNHFAQGPFSGTLEK